MKAYEQEAEDFKMKYIHSHIALTEHQRGVVALWLHYLNHRSYLDLRVADDAGGTDKSEVKGVGVECTAEAEVKSIDAKETIESEVKGIDAQETS